MYLGLAQLTHSSHRSDGVQTTVLANDLVPGDVVTFSTGDRVPADVRVAEAVQLEVDESTLTGEIKPRRKHADVVPRHAGGEECGISERENIAFMGTLVKSGELGCCDYDR